MDKVSKNWRDAPREAIREIFVNLAHVTKIIVTANEAAVFAGAAIGLCASVEFWVRRQKLRREMATGRTNKLVALVCSALPVPSRTS